MVSKCKADLFAARTVKARLYSFSFVGTLIALLFQQPLWYDHSKTTPLAA